MKNIYTILVAITIYLNINAQNFKWLGHINGNTNNLNITDVQVDMDGNSYLLGEFRNSIDVDPGPGVYNMTSNGNNDIFILKLNSSGSLIWAKQIGGQQNDYGKSIAINNANSIYITGSVGSNVDFDPGADTAFIPSFGNEDIFLLKLDTAGNYLWAKRIGASEYEGGTNILIDNANNLIITGWFFGNPGYTVDFDPGTGIYNLTTSGLRDVFILKLDSSANFIWARSIGGVEYDDIISVTADNQNNLYITGTFKDTLDFDPGIGIFNLYSNGNEDLYILKLDVNGNFVWAKSIGGSGVDKPTSIIADNPGNQILISGNYQNTLDIDPGVGVINQNSNGMDDFFILSLDFNGNYLWSITTGGINSDKVNDIKIDLYGNIYATGYFKGTVDFDPGTSTSLLTSNISNQGNSTDDIFFAKYNNTGNLIYAYSLGGEFSDQGIDIYIDNIFNIYLAGLFNGTVDFDPGPGVAITTATTSQNIFILKLSQCTPSSLTTTTTNPLCNGATGSATVTATGNAPFTYSWSNGQTTQTATALTAGTHSVTVTDDSSCAALTTVTITEPPAIVSNVSSTPTNFNSPNCNGSVSINPTGGTPPYNISWSSGATTNLCEGWYTATITDANGCVETDSVYVDFVTGIEELNAAGISIYPNPVNDILIINSEIEIGEIKIFDVVGKLIYQEVFKNNNSEIDVKGFDVGVYFLEAENYRGKFVKR